MVVAENVGFMFEADVFKSVPMIPCFGRHGQHGTFHHKKPVVAEHVGFIFETDLFKSAPMFLSSGCHR